MPVESLEARLEETKVVKDLIRLARKQVVKSYIDWLATAFVMPISFCSIVYILSNRATDRKTFPEFVTAGLAVSIYYSKDFRNRISYISDKIDKDTDKLSGYQSELKRLEKKIYKGYL